MQVRATPKTLYSTAAATRRETKPTIKREAIITRGLDVSLAIAAVLILLPVFLLIVLAIKLTSPGPVLFAHHRIGKGGKVFPCYKFRSMEVNSAELLEQHLANCPEAKAEWLRDQKLRNDPRITWIGKFLRRTSLDEVPQIFNVLRGEMSIVGPRPIVESEVIRYRQYIADYMTVKPGITGLWQISGRNNTTYRRRVALDTAYARTRNVKLDLLIMARTLPAVALGSGCY